MIILQIVKNLKPGGAQYLLLRLCEGFNKRSDKVIVISLEDNLQIKNKFDELGIVVFYPDQTGVGKRNCKITRFFANALCLFKVIKKEKPEIVHTHLLTADRIGLIVAFLAGVKCRVSTAHNMENDKTLFQKCMRKIVAFLAQKVVAVSYSAKKFYIKNSIYPRKKIEVVYNPPGFNPLGDVSLPASLPVDGKARGMRIVNLAKYSPQKGQLYLIRAIGQFSYKEIQLDIYGSDIQGYKKVLQEEVERLGLRNVFLHEPTNTPKKIIKEACIIVSSSLWEACPMIPIETMHIGKPIIVTDIDPHKEILQGIDPVIFVSPENPDEIAEKISRIINDQNMYEKISRQMLQKAKAFTIDRTVNNYYQLYKKMLMKSR